MTRRRRTVRRLVGAALAALGLVMVGSTVTHADGDSCGGSASIEIALSDGSTQTVTSSQLCAAADVFNTTYETRSTSTGKPAKEPVVTQGTSIRALLSSLGVNPDTADFVDVPRADGTWTTLSSADLADPSDFVDALEPVFVVNGDHIDYYRPLRDLKTDINAGDQVESSDGGTLHVGVHSGPLLSVTATVSTTKTNTHAPVQFKAAVSGGGAASEPYKYAWTFGDGSTGAGRSVNHPFTAAGTYEAQVSVSGADDSGGMSPQIAVTIGTPTKGGGHGGGNGGGHPGNGNGGGGGSGGGGQHSGGQHSGGQSTHHGNGNGGNPNGAPTSTPSPEGTPLTLPSLPAFPSEPPTSVVQGSNPVTETPPVIANSLPTVTGQVLSPGMTLSAEQTSIAAKAAPPAVLLTNPPLKLTAGVATIAGVIALLVLGVARELRATHHRTAADK